MIGPSAEDMPPLADEAGGVCFQRCIARAKVNLTLEILGRRPDGYHELRSLVAFTRFGDELKLDPGGPFSLSIDGPFAAALQGGGNLIATAASLFANAAHASGRSGGVMAAASEAGATSQAVGGAFRLTKRIPVAAGLGGGSADAAAALRLLANLSPPPSDLPGLVPLAAKLGADVPACLFSRPAIMSGIGERLAFLPRFPAIPIVLVNPGAPLATSAVFRELRAAPVQSSGDDDAPPVLADLGDVIAYARTRRNDLEPPARRLMPVVGAMLDRLEQCPGALLARLSGSGPTCFALFREPREADAAATLLQAERPGWWVAATMLN